MKKNKLLGKINKEKKLKVVNYRNIEKICGLGPDENNESKK